MSGEPTAPTPTDRATSDSTPPVPTNAIDQATAKHVTREHVTAREIAEFLRDLAELRRGAGDPSARAAFLARKAELLGRLATDPTSTPAHQRSAL